MTVGAIVDAALELIARGGVAALTMRALADELGVRAPSLYHHVAGKEALLALVAAHGRRDAEASTASVFAAVEDVDGWLATTRAYVLEARAFYVRLPGLAAVMIAQQTADRVSDQAPRSRIIAAQVDALVRLGLTPGAARTLYEASARWVLAAIAAETVAAPPAGAGLFERGLDVFLEGMARAIDARGAPATAHNAGRGPSSGAGAPR